MTVLRELRKRRGLPIVEVSFYAEMDDGAFSKAERGYKPFPKEARRKIARKLGTACEELFDERGFAKKRNRGRSV